MNPILSVRDLSKHFVSTQGPLWRRRRHTVRAVDGIGFDLARNSTMGLVGESGCGKTTTGMMLIGLETPTAGSIEVAGRPMNTLSADELKALRRKMQMVFQDPFASLDPMWNLGQIITEPFLIHQMYSPQERQERAIRLLSTVGLDGTYLGRYPHELSGGQRQRVAIARALALEPDFIVADEPTSALDVSVKSQIINLLEELRDKAGLSMVFISHDLSVVHHICDTIQVMFFGKIVESGSTESIFRNPVHPYTRVLLESIPIADPRRRRMQALEMKEQKAVSRSLLGPRFSLDPDGIPQENEGLHEIEPGHFVRCYRR